MTDLTLYTTREREIRAQALRDAQKMIQESQDELTDQLSDIYELLLSAANEVDTKPSRRYDYSVYVRGRGVVYENLPLTRSDGKSCFYSREIEFEPRT